MKLLSAEFVTSAAGGEVPRDGLAQIALVGRSNVGKSSLINALTRSKIARTSAAPGKTRLANVYRVALEAGPGGPGGWSVYLVDLPGYGYARGGADAASELRAIAEACFGRQRGGARNFGSASSTWTADNPGLQRGDQGRSDADLKFRAPLSAVLLLIDSRHPALETDQAAAQWLEGLGLRPIVVATKIDKLTRAERARNLKTLETTFGMAAAPVSAQSGEGLDDLWQMIAKLARKP